MLYEPAAVAEHRRFNLPERRAAMPAVVNFHSLKNRYLLRLYHQTAGNLAPHLPAHPGARPAALGYVLLRERSSLAAYAWLWRHRARRSCAGGGSIQARRTVPAAGGRPLVLDRRESPYEGREPLSVALIGSRGIPARYGGYETLMEELAAGLVDWSGRLIGTRSTFSTSTTS